MGPHMAQPAVEPTLALFEEPRRAARFVAEALEDGDAGRGAEPARTLVVVPSETALELVQRAIEARWLGVDRDGRDAGRAFVLPTLRTPTTLVEELHALSPEPLRLADPILREGVVERALTGAAREHEPPFDVRPSLAAAALRFYDELRAGGFTLEELESAALEEFDVPDDLGAQKLVEQTRFLVAALADYRSTLASLGYEDLAAARRRLTGATIPYDRILVYSVHSLSAAELRLLVRARGPRSVELLAIGGESDAPEIEGLEEAPTIHRASEKARLASGASLVARDREESLVDAIRVLTALGADTERSAIVVSRPLPYLYLARKTFRDASVPYRLDDSFPLAAETFVAAVDVVLELVEADARRTAALDFLRNPFFTFPGVGPSEVAAFESMTLRFRATGGFSQWERLRDRLARAPGQPALPGMGGGGETELALPALEALVSVGERLGPLRTGGDDGAPPTVRAGIACLTSFLLELAPPEDDPRHQRARAAVLEILERLEQTETLLGERSLPFRDLREKLRRAFEARTFDERAAGSGVTIVDADSAVFGDFDDVVVLGMNDGEWPARGPRNIFYPQSFLRRFGWPSDRELLASERRRFRSLIRLPAERVALLRHQLEDEAPTVASPFLDEVSELVEGGAPALASPEALAGLVVTRSEALRRGLLRPEAPLPARGPAGVVGGPLRVPDPVSPTALELYLRCPFKYLSRHLLGLEEEEDLDDVLSPLERGRILHEVLEQGFRLWDQGRDAPRPIDAESYDEALALFRDLAKRKIPRDGRAIELARLFGSSGEPGAIEWLLRWELSREPPRRRLVEHAFRTPLRLDRGPEGERPWFVRVKGRIDRTDVDDFGQLHVLDYKTGRAPDAAVTLQVPLYAMCLSQELAAPVREAAYLSFRDRRAVARTDFDDARSRLVETVGAIRAGSFPPSPYLDTLCSSCGYVGVCRREIEERT